MTERTPELIKLAGLYLNADKNGEPFLKGALTNSTMVFVYKNVMKKEGETTPDYYMYITKKAK